MKKYYSTRIVFALLASLIRRYTQAVPLPLPFGTLQGDTFTGPNDDQSSVAIPLELEMKFFGEYVDQVFHNTNGDITFDTAYSSYTPELIPSVTVPPMIALYWTDIDTGNGGNGKNELWIRATRDLRDLIRCNLLVQRLGVDFTADAAIVATWNNVEAYNQRVGPENTFQLIVAYNSLQTYAIFAYEKLEFFSTDTSQESFVGFNDRQGIEGRLLLSVNDNKIMQTLLTGSNVDTEGLYVYSIGDTIDITGCGFSDIQPVLFPFYGSVFGGTVIKIENLPVCLTDQTIEVYCRFRGVDFDVIQQGLIVNEAVVECLTPFVGFDTSAEVLYTIHDPQNGPFIRDVSVWITIFNRFQYQGELGSVVLESPGLIEINTDITIKWSSWSLLTTAYASCGNEADLSVFLQVLVFDLVSNVFEEVKSIPIDPITADSTTFTLAFDDIAAYLTLFGGQEYAAGLIRIVASTNGRVCAVKSSRLVAFMDEVNQDVDVCPISMDDCPDLANPPPCPPNYATADADPNFTDDSSCRFPDGAGICNEDIEIFVDIDLTCYLYDFNPLQCIYSDTELYVDTTSCTCNFFHNGAAGCMRNAGSQCCYSASGGLITDPHSGAGTSDCFAVRGMLSAINHFFYDVVPYIFCCKVLGGTACDDYFEKRPPVSDVGYVDPNPPARANGDPHVRTLDGFDYDFNGSGEYVAFCGILGTGKLPANAILSDCNPNQRRLLAANAMVSLHYRFARLNPSDGGTVTIAFALADPLHRNGEHSIAVVPHPTRRIDVFDGTTRLNFPDVSGPESSVILASGFSIKKIVSQEGIKFIFLSPSGCRLEASEVEGVWLTSFSPPQGLFGRAAGLLGLVDGVSANDLLSSSGVQIDISSSAREIFTSFGQSWMIQQATSSLFQAFGGSAQSFDNFYEPSFIPSFEAPAMSAALKLLADIACKDIKSDSIRNACYFDIAVTGNATTFRAAAKSAVEEDRARVQVLANSAPVLSVSSKEILVSPGSTASFSIKATDADSDKILLTLDRNDSNLFQLNPSTINGQGELLFVGTETPGTYFGNVGVSDGIEGVLFSATVIVGEETVPSPPIGTQCPSCLGIFSNSGQLVHFDFFGLICINQCIRFRPEILFFFGWKCGLC